VEKIKKDREKTCCQKYIRNVLTDINMPVMDGHEATRKILEIVALNITTDDEVDYINIAAITGNTDDATLEKCISNGIKLVFHKAFQLKDLYNYVASVSGDNLGRLPVSRS
jgi:CheY-like chemotaxis protein